MDLSGAPGTGVPRSRSRLSRAAGCWSSGCAGGSGAPAHGPAARKPGLSGGVQRPDGREQRLQGVEQIMQLKPRDDHRPAVAGTLSSAITACQGTSGVEGRRTITPGAGWARRNAHRRSNCFGMAAYSPGGLPAARVQDLAGVGLRTNGSVRLTYRLYDGFVQVPALVRCVCRLCREVTCTCTYRPEGRELGTMGTALIVHPDGTIIDVNLKPGGAAPSSRSGGRTSGRASVPLTDSEVGRVAPSWHAQAAISRDGGGRSR